MPSTKTTPRIYVACLGCYNSGKLNGHWFDVDDYVGHTTHDGSELAEAIAEAFGADEETGYLACGDVSPHEETAIHDFEGFGPYTVDEYDSLDTVCGIVAVAEEYGEAAYALASYESTYEDADTLRSAMEDRYRGEYQDERAFAHDWADQMGHKVPDWLLGNVSWEGVARDLFMGEYFSIEGGAGVYVFTRY